LVDELRKLSFEFYDKYSSQLIKEAMVKRILLNGANLTGLGAKAIFSGIIPALVNTMQDIEFLILLPEEDVFITMVFPSNSRVLYIKRRKKRNILSAMDRFWQLTIDIPSIAKREKANLVFSLGDLSPAFSNCPRIAYVHQSMLVYEDNEIAGMRGWSNFEKFFITNYFFWTSHHQNFIVQTGVMKERLARKYRINKDRIDIIPQAIPIHVSKNVDKNDTLAMIADCGKPIRLLFLSAYYPHKNHAILPKVADELRREKLTSKVHIFTTLSDEQESSKAIRQEINLYGDVITNLGHLDEASVAAALRSSTALFLPTLIESFGNIYIEAMEVGLPILTSDLDFAHWVCDELALFFDPFSAISIVDSIKKLPAFLNHLSDYQDAAKANLARFPRDQQVGAEKMAAVLRKVMEQRVP